MRACSSRFMRWRRGREVGLRRGLAGVFYNLQENAAVVTRRSAAQLDEARLRVEEVAQNMAAGDFQASGDSIASFVRITICVQRRRSGCLRGGRERRRQGEEDGQSMR